MRTEVKAGLIVGLIVIGGVAFYLFKRGGASQQVQRIPWKVQREEAGGEDRIALADQRARDLGKSPAADATAARPSGRRPASGRGDQGPVGAPKAGPSASTAPTGVTGRAGPAPTTQIAPPSAAPPTTQPAVAAGPTGLPGVAVPPRQQETPRADERAAQVRDAEKPPPTASRYTVQRGDTLSSIAREYYGETRYWTRIRDANPGVDPDRLRVGQVIVLPPKEAAAVPQTGPRLPVAGRATYVVETGDTLIRIARNVLGDGARWKEIYELNRDKIANPDVLLVGTELRMPPIERKQVPSPKP